MSDSLGPRPYTFMPGYDTTRGKSRYMNVGYVESPYPGKKGEGDWGPLQGGGVYYQPYNPTYPYPLNYASSIPKSEQPLLTYAQDIPTYLRAEDMAIHGVSDRKAPPDSNKVPNYMSSPSYQRNKDGFAGGSCGSCYEHRF